MVQRFSQRVRFSGLGFSFQRSSSHNQPCNSRVSTVNSLSTEEPDVRGRSDRLAALCCKWHWSQLAQNTPYSPLPFGLNKSLVFPASWRNRHSQRCLRGTRKHSILLPVITIPCLKCSDKNIFPTETRVEVQVHLHFFSEPLYFFMKATERET